MKNHKIDETDSTVTVCVELNNREFSDEPIETFSFDMVENILKTNGHDTSKLTFASGPKSITNYTTKGWGPAKLTGEWTFNKKIQKVEKKVNKVEIKSEAKTSNKRRRTKTKTTSWGLDVKSHIIFTNKKLGKMPILPQTC